ncbi:MAG TPA: transcriptional regulator CysB [Rhodocyclaceae bacterium]|nr:MAG: transcriptional regulator CysB [Betaproteobacteria bacterium CG2_30_68_42]PIX75106.1 MAG: transcriptional regulator CysB [Rhodocyclales bacterium CG_4_10_14_3_um_filter_68_10]PJA56843.1 MAG: transcriptional regulator CysB [Rhodocyclales bacterium CG_4_9_14_3_um_filter_68_10]HCX34376.1 transcriptional regulator CysB [Rhodocyclaceae bacterium]
MNLRQLRYVFETARQGFNISGAAAALHTSQPGVSKQVRLLEEELGVAVFVRQGKRLTGITEPGGEVLKIAERMLRDADNLRAIGREFGIEEAGTLAIATTHTQARYVLPPVIREFLRRHPAVRVHLHQGSPSEVCRCVLSGEADIAIATEAINDQEGLAMLPCYRWNRCVIAAPGHPILDARPLTLEEIAKYPIVTYDFAFTGRSQINAAFAARGLSPNVVLTAIDADIIKTYVALGLGIGIVAYMAYEPGRDAGLRAVDAAHLFESATTRIGLRPGTWLRGYAFTFIELFAPHLTRATIAAAVAGTEGSDPGL